MDEVAKAIGQLQGTMESVQGHLQSLDRSFDAHVQGEAKHRSRVEGELGSLKSKVEGIAECVSSTSNGGSKSRDASRLTLAGLGGGGAGAGVLEVVRRWLGGDSP